MHIHYGHGPAAGPRCSARCWPARPARRRRARRTANGAPTAATSPITRHAPLDQIDAGNFADLEVAWRFSTANLGPETEYNLQATPLMVDGVLYSTGGTRRAAFAVDAGTGELLWIHRLDEGERAEVSPRRRSGRGLAYRDDGADGQIFYATTGYRLVALNARTGERLAAFGDGRRSSI